ncbi:hypothetical protein SSX86_020824 [Deinandra increscens subsp. villosa]|uniref:Uncharacterized protein n=1 Tax=Deinandra increscens subsp. villosa TaxID=3103831 RepID=A0AAP0GV50_9ASTR
MEPPHEFHTLNFSGVLSTSKKIILTNYTHLITLSLFFLPLSFSLMITTPTLPENPFSDDLPNHHQKLIISYLLLILIIHILSLCATATITYSTHHVFSGEPVTISDSVKSLTASFFPLASTAIVSYALTILISLTFFMFVGIILMLVHNLCFVIIDYNSIYFMWFSAIMGAVLIAIIVYFHVEWSLASTVVVVESKWGFAALTRSAYLVKGMRSVSLLVMLYFGVCGAVIVWIFEVPNTWVFVIINKTLGTFLLMIFLLRITAANTVLYNYCKALHGELAIKVAEGFGKDYVKLPADYEKVPQVVSVLTV